MASLRAQPERTGYFSVLRRYASLLCNKHTMLAKPCGTKKYPRRYIRIQCE